MIETIATVESNLEIVSGYRLLTLNFEEEIEARAGQFAMLRARASFEPLLRRALAVYRVQGKRQMSFLYQVLGRGTAQLSLVERGGEVEALIPLGNYWPVEMREGSSIKSPRRAMVVAGGIGSASVLMLCEELARAHIDTQIFFGAANERVASGCGLEDFRALGLPLTITTDDGSLGERGFVTAPLERQLQDEVRKKPLYGADSTIYACGPWPMMARVAAIAAQFDVRCLVSLEAPMGCGFGVCVGCTVAVKTDEPLGYGSYRRVCTDGTIFKAETIRWEVNAMSH